MKIKNLYKITFLSCVAGLIGCAEANFSNQGIESKSFGQNGSFDFGDTAGGLFCTEDSVSNQTDGGTGDDLADNQNDGGNGDDSVVNQDGGNAGNGNCGENMTCPEQNLENGGEVPNGEVVGQHQIPGCTLDWYKIEVNFVEDGKMCDCKVDDEHIVVGPDTQILIVPTTQEDTWTAIDPNGLDDNKVIIKATSWKVGPHRVVLFGQEPDGIGIDEFVVAMDAGSGEMIDATDAILNPIVPACGAKVKVSVFDDKFNGIFWSSDKGARQFRLYMGEIKK